MKKILFFMLSVSFAFANLGDWNVGSWNLQGSSASTESKWNVSIRQLITGQNPVDILAVQEAGTLPSTAVATTRTFQPRGSTIMVQEYTWNLGTRTRPNSVYIYYTRIDLGANRVNLAIVSQRMADEILLLPPPTVASRPILGIRIGRDAFFNIHALSRGGNDGGAILHAIDAALRPTPDISWMVLGDFNREPNNLRELVDRELLSRISFFAPPSLTQTSGRTLDYAVTGSSDTTRRYQAPLLTAVLFLAGLRSYLASDHFPVNIRKF